MSHRTRTREGGMLDRQTQGRWEPEDGAAPKLLVRFWCGYAHGNSPCTGKAKGFVSEEGFWVSDSVGGGEEGSLNPHCQCPAKTQLKTLWKWLGIVLPSHSDDLKKNFI